VEVIIHNIVHDADNGRGTSTRRRPRKSIRCRRKRGRHVVDDSSATSGLSSRRLRPKVVVVVAVVVDVIIHDVVVATMKERRRDDNFHDTVSIDVVVVVTLVVTRSSSLLSQVMRVSQYFNFCLAFSFFGINQLNIKFKFPRPKRQISGQTCDNKTTIPEDADSVWIKYSPGCYKLYIACWTHFAVSVNTTSAPSTHRRPLFVDCHRRHHARTDISQQQLTKAS